MATVHRYKGKDGSYDWDGVIPDSYALRGAKGSTVRYLIGPAEKSPNFEIRYFEVEPGGQTSLDFHAHDHGVVVVRGKGKVLLAQGEEISLSFGDVLYIRPYEMHRLVPIGDEPFGFICVVPAKR